MRRSLFGFLSLSVLAFACTTETIIKREVPAGPGTDVDAGPVDDAATTTKVRITATLVGPIPLRALSRRPATKIDAITPTAVAAVAVEVRLLRRETVRFAMQPLYACRARGETVSEKA